MRSLMIPLMALTLLLPAAATVARADSNVRFHFSYGDTYKPFYHPRYYPKSSTYHYNPYYYGSYYGRYAVPRVYTPYRYRWGDYRWDHLNRAPLRKDDYKFRGSLYRGGDYYYGPAVERYHRDRRDFPSRHFDRRENYIRRGSDHDRGSRYDRR